MNLTAQKNGYLLPDKRYKPLGSTAKLVTESKCATIEWISLPEKETHHLEIHSLFAIIYVDKPC